MGSILKYDNNEISKLYKENSYNKLAQILKRTYKDELRFYKRNNTAWTASCGRPCLRPGA